MGLVLARSVQREGPESRLEVHLARTIAIMRLSVSLFRASWLVAEVLRFPSSVNAVNG